MAAGTRTRSSLGGHDGPRSPASSPSTTTSWSRRRSGPTGCRPSTSTGRPGSSATGRSSTSRAASSPTSGASTDGEWCDWWLYDDLVYPFPKLSAAIGFDDLDVTPTTFDDIRPGCWIQSERLADMTANHVEASLCFPNTLPRFAGQAFYERADKELALLCVQAYNDWMLDEWSAGEGKGRLLPLTIVPLWDAELAAAEVRRCADKGSLGIAFSENPHPLGLPSVHDKGRFWDPLFRACEETGTVVCMHIGSSSKMPATSPDAPFIVSSTLTFSNAMGSMLDFIFSGTLERFPELVIAYSEGQVGWMPYVLERADKLWAERGDNSFGTSPPAQAVELHPPPHLRLRVRRRGRPAQPRPHRHGPDLLRDRLPARRLDVPAQRRRSPPTSSPRPAWTTRRPGSSCGATPSAASSSTSAAASRA